MRTGVVIAFLLSFPLLVQAQSELQEGKWKFSIDYFFVGVPQHFPSYSKTQCITKQNPFPEISRVGHECKRQQAGHFGHTYTWQVDCSTDWEMVQGLGRIHYWDDVAQGDVHLQVINPFNPPQPMVFRINGQRLGRCED